MAGKPGCTPGAALLCSDGGRLAAPRVTCCTWLGCVAASKALWGSLSARACLLDQARAVQVAEGDCVRRAHQGVARLSDQAQQQRVRQLWRRPCAGRRLSASLPTGSRACLHIRLCACSAVAEQGGSPTNAPPRKCTTPCGARSMGATTQLLSTCRCPVCVRPRSRAGRG